MNLLHQGGTFGAEDAVAIIGSSDQMIAQKSNAGG
jgi:hypothetical protein